MLSGRELEGVGAVGKSDLTHIAGDPCSGHDLNLGLVRGPPILRSFYDIASIVQVLSFIFDCEEVEATPTPTRGAAGVVARCERRAMSRTSAIDHHVANFPQMTLDSST